jgi:hypothetical protein
LSRRVHISREAVYALVVVVGIVLIIVSHEFHG